MKSGVSTVGVDRPSSAEDISRTNGDRRPAHRSFVPPFEVNHRVVTWFARIVTCGARS